MQSMMKEEGGERQDSVKKDTLMDSRPNDDQLRGSEMTKDNGTIKDEW